MSHDQEDEPSESTVQSPAVYDGRKTIRDSNRLIRKLNKFKDEGKLGKDYESCLSTMKRLLTGSERILVDAEATIAKISGEMSETMANIEVFQGIVKKAKQEYKKAKAAGTSTKDILVDAASIVSKINKEDNWMDGVVASLPNFIKLGSVVEQLLTTPDLTEKFDSILGDLTGLENKVKAEWENLKKEEALVQNSENCCGE